MAELFGNSDDGQVVGPNGAWAQCRDSDLGNGVAAGSTGAANFTATNMFASRGGSNLFRCELSFMYFDTSGITGTVASAKFEIVGNGSSDGSIIAVKSTAFGGDGGTALSNADFDAMPGWTDGASQAGNVTNYSAAFESTSGTWQQASVNNLTATNDLLEDMKNNDVVIVCFLDYTNDYLNVTPSSVGTLNISGRFFEQSNSAARPRIDFTLAGYTNTVIGIAPGNIGKVIGVATTDIGKVIGVD